MAVPAPSSSSPSREPNFDAVRLAAHIRRQELSLTLKQVVLRAQIAESTVTGVLYGYHEGSVRTWWSLARALDMPLGELLQHLDDNGTSEICPLPTAETI